ncbi:electron transfer flavoprotein subunit alpha/FixB family protein [Veillonella agrestimuris]|uniref:electron transfer flavoprotein subunit alpha/FixB family protein n=1 Tax=Veillonella agrestimuris TaxID=2941340 RepID=UPI00203A39A0|nr:electron transfer flavoprotein subunit alpha/FixB family protein [Veillonella agrestimuris]
MANTQFADYKDVFVVADTIDDVVHPVTIELIGQARNIAKELGQLVQVMLLGEHVQAQAEELVAYGADIVHVFESPLLKHYSTDGYTKVLADFFSHNKPNVILIGATNNGRDLAPRMSGRMQNGVVADCTILTVDTEEGLVEWTRPALGGNILAEIISPNHRPQMGSVRPNVFKKPERNDATWGRVQVEPVNLTEADIRTKRLDFIPFSSEGYNIEEAQIIVAGGRGIGSKENFDKLYELAEALGGVVGATRPLVEKGWIELPYQVGQTGKTVSPKLYLAFGISGAIQHVSGISGSDTIIAINNDPNAEIFQHANYGIVGDCMDVVNAMLERLR